MRWVFSTPFGRPVEPEVKRILAAWSGLTRACAASTADAGGVCNSAASDVVARSAGAFAVTATSTSRGSAAAMARANAVPLLAKTRPGERISMMDLSLPKSCDNSEYGTEIGA